MKRFILIVLLILMCFPLVSQTLVFPFQVDSRSHANWQWLGRAFSYYIGLALELNQKAVISDEELSWILENARIPFPYVVTKATAMSLGRKHGAARLIWGRIGYDAANSTQMQLSVSVIDLEADKQKNLASSRGHFKDMFALLEQVFLNILQAESRASEKPKYPSFRMGLYGFERLVKSLLVDDSQKRLEILSMISPNDASGDYYKWERGKALIDAGDCIGAETVLQTITPTILFKKRRDFFLALAALGAGNLNLSQERLLRLHEDGIYPRETLNNLGVIELKKHNFSQAEAFFNRALEIGRNPEILFNYFLALHYKGRDEEVLRRISSFLAVFPGDEMLTRLFCRLLLSQLQREWLVQGFEEYIPAEYWKDDVDSLEPLPLNPLEFWDGPPNPGDAEFHFVEARNHFLENETEAAREKVKQALELNPFRADYHYLLSVISLQGKRRGAALTAARVAFFLEESPENRELVGRIEKMGG